MSEKGEDNGNRQTDPQARDNTPQEPNPSNPRFAPAPPRSAYQGATLGSNTSKTTIGAGEIVAYRAWKMGVSSYLHSVHFDNFRWWPDRPVEADWSQGSNRDAGIYAMKSLDGIAQYIPWYRDSRGYSGDFIAGVAELWGTVYEHELGYRAEFARIRALMPLERVCTDLDKIRHYCALYNVPMEYP